MISESPQTADIPPGLPPGSTIPAYQATTLLHRLKFKIISHLNTYAHTPKITLQSH